MNQPRQFISLFVFQAKQNPFVWFMMLVLILPILYVPLFLRSYHQGFETLLNVPNLFFIAIMGIWILAPEWAQTRWTGSASYVSATEFLVALALDRRILYRSRAALFYLAALAAPAIMLLITIRSPDLTVTEYDKPARLACLHAMTGSTLQSDPSGSTSPLIHVPGGNVLVGEWHLWMFLTAALLAQVAFCFLFSLKHRLAVFYALFLGTSFVPLIITLARGSHSYFPLNERLFFFFAGHQMIFWLASEAVFIAGQLWCEERFIRQQY